MLLIKITISLERLNLILKLSLRKDFHSNLYEIGNSMLNIIIVKFYNKETC